MEESYTLAELNAICGMTTGRPKAFFGEPVTLKGLPSPLSVCVDRTTVDCSESLGSERFLGPRSRRSLSRYSDIRDLFINAQTTVTTDAELSLPAFVRVSLAAEVSSRWHVSSEWIRATLPCRASEGLCFPSRPRLVGMWEGACSRVVSVIDCLITQLCLPRPIITLPLLLSKGLLAEAYLHFAYTTMPVVWLEGRCHCNHVTARLSHQFDFA